MPEGASIWMTPIKNASMPIHICPLLFPWMNPVVSYFFIKRTTLYKSYCLRSSEYELYHYMASSTLYGRLLFCEQTRRMYMMNTSVRESGIWKLWNCAYSGIRRRLNTTIQYREESWLDQTDVPFSNPNDAACIHNQTTDQYTEYVWLSDQCT